MKYGWENSHRVPVTQDVSDAEGDVVVHAPAGWWPSEDRQRLYLSILSREEAADLADHVRCRVMEWLTRDGLEPTALAWRWVWLQAVVMGGACDEAWGDGPSSGGWAQWVWSRIACRGLDWRSAAAMSAEAMERSVRNGRMEEVVRGLSVVAPWSMLAAAADDWSGPSLEGGSADGDEVGAEVEALARAAARMLVEWLGEGSGLVAVLQRIYGLIFWRYKWIAPGMTGADYAALLCQGRAAFSAATKRLFEEPGERLLGTRVKTCGQKSAESAGIYAARAAAQCPRRQLAGLWTEGRALNAEAADAMREAEAVAADWDLARAYVDHVGEGAPRLRTDRQREFARLLAERDGGEPLGRRRG